jgi:hypothetical protein
MREANTHCLLAPPLRIVTTGCPRHSERRRCVPDPHALVHCPLLIRGPPWCLGHGGCNASRLLARCRACAATARVVVAWKSDSGEIRRGSAWSDCVCGDRCPELSPHTLLHSLARSHHHHRWSSSCPVATPARRQWCSRLSMMGTSCCCCTCACQPRGARAVHPLRG